MKEIALHQNICLLIKLIRRYKGIKQEYVAHKSGYTNRSVYSKLESGKLKHLSVARFYAICEALSCDSTKVILLASIKEFNYKINSWSEFMESINLVEEEEKKELLAKVKELFPESELLSSE